jgi:cobalt-zinc-cadmium resistance protein CzcA
MRFNELLAGAVTDVTAAIHGQDLGELRRIGEAVVEAVRGQPGVADAHLLAPPDVPVIEVRPQPLAASQLGLSPREVMEAVQAVRAGLEVGVTFDGPVRVPLRLRLHSSISAFDVETLGLPTRTGAVVPLGRVAEVSRGLAPTLVNHLQGERRLLVGFNVRGADLGRAVATASARVEETVKFPDGYRLEWGGQYQALEEAQRRLAVVIPVVVLLILGVLAVAFQRVQPALVVFLNVPFACVGGIAALVVRGMPISLSAAVGFIALSGIAVLNGVVLISRVLAAEAEGRSPAEAMEEGARSRVRPVVTTALVAALGFVPMALATGVGAEVQRPLATVVIGGLVTSTLLTLVIVPALYPRLAVRRRSGELRPGNQG